MKFSYHNIPLSEVKRIIEKNKNIFNHDIQRQSVWNEKKKNLLISSIWRNFPYSTIIIHSSKQTKGKNLQNNKNWTYYNELRVLDGFQRLQTIYDYIEGNLEFKIYDEYDKDKDFLSLENKKFNNLNSQLQGEFLKKRKISVCYIYDDKKIFNFNNDERLYKIFERLNTGAVNLNAQELRMAIYPSDLTKKLKKVQSSKDIKSFYLNKNNKLFTENNWKRQKIIEFISTLYFMIYEHGKNLMGTSKNEIDIFYKNFSKGSLKVENREWGNFLLELYYFLQKYNIALEKIRKKSMSSPLYFLVIYNLYLNNELKFSNDNELINILIKFLNLKELDDKLIRRSPTSAKTKEWVKEIILKNI